MADGIILRFGEIFLKKGRRPHFLRALERNVRHALRWMGPLRIEQPYGRILVRLQGGGPIPEIERALESLGSVFGLQGMSPIFYLPPDAEPEALLQQAFALCEPWFRARPVRRFRVAANRADKRFPLRSLELNAQLGGLILDAFPQLQVDLTQPDLTVGLEVRPDVRFVYCDAYPGPGGLPVGSSGRALLLLSGGIDSPVAGYLAMKRGCAVDAVYFHSFPFTGEHSRDKVIELARLLQRHQHAMRVYVVPFTNIQQACRDHAPAEQLVLLYRRFMVRLAERVARDIGALALVTGESLGQVASQTLPNLHAIGSVARLPILRPLITNDKVETTAMARRIGTYEVSIQPFDDCCSLFVPKHPELRGDPERLAAIESGLDVAGLEADALARIEIVRLPEERA